MINNKIISHILGQLLFVVSVMLTVCLGVGIIYHEDVWFAFGVPVLISLFLGFVLVFMGRGAEVAMSRRDSYLVVSLTWIVFAAVGTMPFMLSGVETRLSVAFFESMSGFTTTGATALKEIDGLPHAILFWRSLMHWVGGVGIIFFTIAVLPQMNVSEMRMFSVETTGLKIAKLHPRIETTAHWIGGLYLTLTIVCAVTYYLCGMGLFDAVNHAFSTMSTGGFSTHASSIAWFHSPMLEWVVTLFMFLGGFNFTLIYIMLVKRRWHPLCKDGELRTYIVLLLSMSVLCTLMLVFIQDREAFSSVRAAVFHVTSLMTTTGFTTENFMKWPIELWLPLTFITAIGACAGSTSGGIKIVRLLTIYKVTTREFRHLLHPRAVFPIRVNGTLIEHTLVRTIFVFFVSYFSLMFVGTIMMISVGVPMLDSVSCCITALSNVGPGIGYMVGPLDSYAPYPDIALWINSFLMLAGRLEIFALLLPFVPEFWKEN